MYASALTSVGSVFWESAIAARSYRQLPDARLGYAALHVLRRKWWNWFFLGQTSKPAEKVIAAVGPGDWYRVNGPDVMGEEAHADLWAALRDPAVVHGMCEDYRARLTIDVEHEQADAAAGRRVRCPTQVLWATREDEGLLGGDPPELLRRWADDIRGAGIDSGHHVAEEAPQATADALMTFWAEVGWS